MALWSLQQATLNLGGKVLLDQADLQIEFGERVCLVGRNGMGKSSLIALFSGDLKADTGEVFIAPGTKAGYMPQNIPVSWQGSVFGVVAQSLGTTGKALALVHLASTQGKQISAPELQTAQDILSSGDGWEKQGDITSVINHLGLDAEADFASLSGGTKRRVALARALLVSDSLLLDEPTNHLDINTISWLEDFLLRRAKTLLFISHDRTFASHLATRVVEIDRGHLYSYACSYDLFQERREARLAVEETHADLFDKKLAQEEAWVRQGIKARRTRNMGRVRALEAMRVTRSARRNQEGNVNLYVQEAEKSGKLVMEIKDLGFIYPDGYEVIKNFSTLIQRGDRIGLMGKNGMGKTTLLRLLLGELEPTTGSIRYGTRLEVSYFDQLRQTLDPQASVMDSVAEGNDIVIINGQSQHVAGYLRDFLFDSNRLRIPVSALSGGERNRLLLAKLFTKPSNVLVLDEPTNDLDVETLELLEELLDSYKGTVLMVSHDRTFLDNLVTSTLALEGDGLVHEYVGGYTDWVRQRGSQGDKKPLESSSLTLINQNKATDIDILHNINLVKKKISFKEQRELELLEKELANIPQLLATLEAEHLHLEELLADPVLFTKDIIAFNTATLRITEISQEESNYLERWEIIEARLAYLDSLDK